MFLTTLDTGGPVVCRLCHVLLCCLEFVLSYMHVGDKNYSLMSLSPISIAYSQIPFYGNCCFVNIILLAVGRHYK